MIACVYRWAVVRDGLARHDEALAALGEHIKADHPLIKGLRGWKVLWGGEVGRPGRVWTEFFESMADYERHEELEYSPACDAVWEPVFATMVPGSMTSAVWQDVVPGARFDR